MIDTVGSYMTLKEAAQILGVHVETMRRAVQQRKLSALRVGRGYKVSQEALSKYIEGQMVGGTRS